MLLHRLLLVKEKVRFSLNPLSPILRERNAIKSCVPDLRLLLEVFWLRIFHLGLTHKR